MSRRTGVLSLATADDSDAKKSYTNNSLPKAEAGTDDPARQPPSFDDPRHGQPGAVLRAQIVSLEAEGKRWQADYDVAEAAMKELEEMGRRVGALPGWFR